ERGCGPHLRGEPVDVDARQRSRTDAGGKRAGGVGKERPPVVSPAFHDQRYVAPAAGREGGQPRRVSEGFAANLGGQHAHVDLAAALSATETEACLYVSAEGRCVGYVEC